METQTVGVEELFRVHERFLWGLCYRMTGNAADADDLVQETFKRVLEKPPAQTEGSWRPWLVRVAMNLGRDAFRRRKRRAYVGPWLPSPIDTETDRAGFCEPVSSDWTGDPEARYEMLESFSFAFLLALETLTAQQRAVLLLRDALGYSVRETADLLDISETNLKTTHHRARAAMQRYDRERCIITPALQARTRRVLEQLADSLRRRDLAGVQALMSEGVRALSDGGGEYAAARVPVKGRRKVARFLQKIADRKGPAGSVAVRGINGLPALVSEFAGVPRGWAPRIVFRVDLDSEGRIKEIHNILAPRKLTGVKFQLAENAGR